jgi:predicted transcriptional regulator
MSDNYYIPVHTKRKKVVRFKNYGYTNPTNDFMKYHKIIIRFVSNKYQIKKADLDVLFYLYTEHIFGKTDIIRTYKMNSSGNGSIDYLIDRGLICLWAGKKKDGMRRDLYHMTMKGKNIVKHTYELFKGEKRMQLTGFENNNLVAAVNSVNREIDAAIPPDQKLEQRLSKL